MVPPLLEALWNRSDEVLEAPDNKSAQQLHTQLDGLEGSESEVTAQFGRRFSVTDQLVLLHQRCHGQAHFIEREPSTHARAWTDAKGHVEMAAGASCRLF